MLASHLPPNIKVSVASGIDAAIRRRQLLRQIESLIASAPVAAARKSVVLVVDDDATICGLAATMLKLHGMESTTASGGVDALRTFDERGDIAALITDVSMPDMTGFCLIGELRSRSPRLPVAVMTGREISPCLQELGRQLEVTAFLEKPFRMNELMAAAEKLMGGE